MEDDSVYKVPVFMQQALRDLVHELVDRNYVGLEADRRAGILNAGQLKQAITNYGGTLLDLPAEAFEPQFTTAYPKTNQRGQWLVDLTLWTEEEGPSDLTLQVRVQPTTDNVLLTIEDIHVM